LPEAERNEYLDDWYVQVMYLSYSLSLTNYEKPILSVLNSDIIPLALGTLTNQEYFLKISTLNTDSGLILESMDTDYTFSYDYSIRSNQVMPKENPYVFNALFTISNVQEIFTRRYIKIQGILAVVGGFMKFLLSFVTFFNNYLIETYFCDDLIMTSLHKTDISSKMGSEAENLKQHATSIIRPLNVNPNLPSNVSYKVKNPKLPSYASHKVENTISANSLQVHKSINSQKNMMMNDIETIKLKEEKSLNNFKPLKFKNILFFCFYKNKKFIGEKIRNNFRKKLDVKNIFYYFHKINFLEKILITENQRKLEKIAIHKKIIHNLTVEKCDKSQIDEKGQINEKNNYIYLLNELKNTNEDDSKINERILKYFEYL
jgi:hypothetical protein